MVKEALYDVLRNSLLIAQNCVRYVLYNVFEQIMLDLLRKDII